MDDASTRFWDLYSHSYDAVRFAIPYQHLLEGLAEALALEPGTRVLDLGCATGNLEAKLAVASPDVEVTGVDYSESMLRRARRKCRRFGNMRFLRADLAQPLPFPDASFDRVVANNVLYALPERDAVLREASRVLRPGGRLVVSDPKAGAKMGELVRAHFAEIAAMPLLPRVVAFARSCVTLPLMGLQPILLITTSVASKMRAGEYRFSTEGELAELLAGFRDVRVTDAYAGQNWLVVAQTGVAASERRTASTAMSSDSSLPVNDITLS